MKLLDYIEKNGWKTIPSHPDYEASKGGFIRHIATGKILKRYDCNGYWSVWIGKARGVHRLITEAFHGICPASKRVAAHWDGIKKNNHPSNLRWATSGENYEDMLRHGTNKSIHGENHSQAKLTEKQALEIFNSKERITHLAKKYSVGNRTIIEIRRKNRWKSIHQDAEKNLPQHNS